MKNTTFLMVNIFVLGDLDDETIERLELLVKEGAKEIIFALTPSLSSDALILYIEDDLKNYSLSFYEDYKAFPQVYAENVGICFPYPKH